MDGVILAAGRGSRLQGLAAPFHKPLMLINGEPLISRAIRQALNHCLHVVVVVAPENAMAITGLTSSRRAVSYVIQPEPNGPRSALLAAMPAVRDGSVLILMADNYNQDEDIQACTNYPFAVGVSSVTPDIATRFTVWNRARHAYEEGVPITKDHIDETGKCRVWVGPLILDRDSINRTHGTLMDVERDRAEALIGPHIVHMVPSTSHEELKHVTVQSMDIGIPEALQ